MQLSSNLALDSHDLLSPFAGLRLLLMPAHAQSPSESPIPPLEYVHAAWMEENAHMYPSTHPPTPPTHPHIYAHSDVNTHVPTYPPTHPLIPTHTSCIHTHTHAHTHTHTRTHTHTPHTTHTHTHTHTPGVTHNRFSSAVQFPFLELEPWHISLPIAVQMPTE